MHPPEPAVASGPTTQRLTSLDAYRGLIMLTLLCGGIFHTLKNNPTWRWLYLQNDHVEWQGCVYWDLIQPSFMFMVGVAMPFAYARRETLGDSWGQRFLHALIRAFNLIVIGIVLDHFGRDSIQIGFIRVLQQIAIGYVIAFFVLGRSFRAQALIAGAVLIGYNLLWMYNPWNGPTGPWAKGNANIGSAFDLWMLGRNYDGYYVGLNAIPSAVTIIFGVMAGELIRRTAHVGTPARAAEFTPRRTMLTLLVAGAGAIAFGLAVSPWFPLIKRIWTPSFAVYAGGWTTLMLLASYWTVEVRGHRRWAFPLVVVGMNSIAAYVMTGAFGGWFRSLTNAWVASLKKPMGDEWFPVFHRLLFVLAAWGVLYWFHRRKIFFKA